MIDGASCYTPLGVVGYFFSPDKLSLMCKINLSSVGGELAQVTFASYLVVFLTTNLLEAPFYYLAFHKNPNAWRKAPLALIGANLATHPTIYFIFPTLAAKFQMTYVAMLLACEIFAPLVETVLLNRVAKIEIKKAAVLMLIANLFSWWLGVHVTL